MAPHPDRVPAVRVLLVGDAGTGKTSLAQLLAEGAAPDEAPLPTQGADVFVRLLHLPDPGGGAPKPHFVELWDVGGDVAHAPLRPLFYSQVAGVILVHDLTRSRAAAGLATWATELAASATFATAAPAAVPGASPASALAARMRELGVPVPTLVIGTRADVAERRRRGASAWVAAAAAAACAPARRFAAGARATLVHHGLGRARPSRGGALLPEFATRQERDAHLFATCTLRTAAPLGRVDAQAVDAFFRACLLAARHTDGGHARSASVGSAGGSPLSHWRDRLLAADVAADGPPHGFGSRFTLDALGAADDGADAGRLRWEDEEGGGGGERALWEP